MDKKKVLKWIIGILANLGALVAVYLTANPQLFPNAKAKKKDSLDAIAAARFLPSYKKSVNPGLLSKIVNEVGDRTLADEKKRQERERKFCRQDTVINRGKISIHLLQQMLFQDEFDTFKKHLTAKNDSKGDKDNNSYNESDWDKFNHIKTSGGLNGSYSLKPGTQVFGWHPYWMGSAYKSYNFSLLSTIAYYGAQVDPATGGIRDTHGWETTGLFSAIGDNNCSVEFTVSNMGEDENADLLSDPMVEESLIDNIILDLKNRGDGVCIDFEGVPTRMKDNFTNFILMLHDSLKTAAKSISDEGTRYVDTFSITIVLPCFDWTGGYDVKKLAPLVNRFVVTGYDYYGSFSDTAGPVAQLRSGLTWTAPNIEKSVDGYLKKGIPPNQLLLGLPYYGVCWQSVNEKVRSPIVRFLNFPLYRGIRDELAMQEINYDTASVSAFYIDKGTLPVQYWFDDSQTLAEKYRYVLRKRLGGVGIWALGYDNGYPDLWQTLLDNFGRDRLAEDTTYKSKFILADHDTTSLPADKEWGIVAANGHYLIFDNPYVLLYGTLGLFAIILLIQVVLDQQPFNELFSKRLLLFILSSLAGTAAIIFLGLALWSKVPHREVYLLIAGIIGGYLLFRLTQRIVGKKEKLP
jgi:hypothetical protein